MEHQLRVAVIGGGIAGVSAASAIAANLGSGESVTLVEQEATLAHHTTGRSAAQLHQNLGHPAIRQITKASLPFFYSPDPALVDAPLLTPCSLLLVATPGQEAELEELYREGVESDSGSLRMTVEEAVAAFPLLRPEMASGVVNEPTGMDIDVAGAHQAYVRKLRSLGGSIVTSSRFDSARPHEDRWLVETTRGDLEVDVIINAAGAWGDVVAAGAGIAPVGLEPKRRTAFMIDSPVGTESADWPMIINAGEQWYVKPDGSQFLCSLAEENPSPPCDAKPEEADVALAIERINEATTMNIRHVRSEWTGLRTFAPDRSMVIGPEPGHERFIWCAGQGGTGIQSSPGAGQLVADLLTHGSAGTLFDTHGVDLDALSPARFR